LPHRLGIGRPPGPFAPSLGPLGSALARLGGSQHEPDLTVAPRQEPPAGESREPFREAQEERPLVLAAGRHGTTPEAQQDRTGARTGLHLAHERWAQDPRDERDELAEHHGLGQDANPHGTRGRPPPARPAPRAGRGLRHRELDPEPA
jgi:hypothetical protein